MLRIFRTESGSLTPEKTMGLFFQEPIFFNKLEGELLS